ncbi:WD40 repeat domain-containing protein [Persephonella sp.]
MLRIAITFIFLIGIAHGKVFKKIDVVDLKSAITEIRVKDNNLYVSVELGKIFVLDLTTKKIKNIIEFPLIENYFGEKLNPKVFSIDICNNGNIVAVIEGSDGTRELKFIDRQTGSISTVIEGKKRISMTKVRFVNDNQVVVATTGDEILLVTLKNGKIHYRKSVGMSTFSDMEINESKTLVAVGDESGDVHIADVKSGNLIKDLTGINVDRLFNVDFRGGKVASGGRDRRVAVYDLKTGKGKRFDGKFLVFGLGLSPSGKYLAYLFNDKNDVAVVNTETGSKVDMLTGHNYTVSVVLFLDESNIIIGCDDGKIFFWRR